MTYIEIMLFVIVFQLSIVIVTLFGIGEEIEK